jgi:hypothetical protein
MTIKQRNGDLTVVTVSPQEEQRMYQRHQQQQKEILIPISLQKCLLH